MAQELIEAKIAKAKSDLVNDFFMWLNFVNHKLKFINTLSYDLTVNVDPEITTVKLVKPLSAGPFTNDPLALNVDP